ncbi:50S ribosome-binding GTPase, partial [bacterium]|nr:50S ribosome-binding GTPase [bacterium]
MDIAKDYTNYRAGYVTIIGRPNSGKSTLMNALLNYKLSIVTNKPQTTRQNVLGILSSDESQIVFLDTPGLLTPRYKLQEAMLNAATTAMKDADVLFFLTDATQSKPEKDIEILKKLKLPAKPIILVFNKID